MRHADVAYVDESGRPVHPERVPLTAEGRVQAAAARDALASAALDLVLASDLPRAVETADARTTRSTRRARRRVDWDRSQLRGLLRL